VHGVGELAHELGEDAGAPKVLVRAGTGNRVREPDGTYSHYERAFGPAE